MGDLGIRHDIRREAHDLLLCTLASLLTWARPQVQGELEGRAGLRGRPVLLCYWTAESVPAALVLDTKSHLLLARDSPDANRMA